MKKLSILFLCLMLIGIGCKKDEKAASPTTPPSTTSTMTATETALVGIWNWDKVEYWNASGVYLTSTPATHPTFAAAYLDLRTTIYGGITTPAPYFYDCIISDGTTGSGTIWQVIPAGTLPIDRLAINPDASTPVFPFYGGFIETLNSTTLIVTSWSGSVPNGTKTYYSR